MTTHSHQVGDIRVLIMQEGTSSYPRENFGGRHPNATDDEVETTLTAQGYTDDTIDNYMNVPLIEVGDTRILVDTGIGIGVREAFGHTFTALADNDIPLESIDIVFITHFHGDHIGGLTDADGNLLFPNATFMMAKQEWDYWTSEETLEKLGERGQGILSKVKPMEANMKLLEDGDTLVEGVKLVFMPGHTMGHSGLLIESNGESLLHAVDLLHHTAQFANPHWHFVYDTDAELGVETRKGILNRAAEDNLLTLFYHLAFPGLGYVKIDGDVYRWDATE